MIPTIDATTAIIITFILLLEDCELSVVGVIT